MIWAWFEPIFRPICSILVNISDRFGKSFPNGLDKFRPFWNNQNGLMFKSGPNMNDKINNVATVQNTFSNGLPFATFRNPKRYNPEVYESRNCIHHNWFEFASASSFRVSEMLIPLKSSFLSERKTNNVAYSIFISQVYCSLTKNVYCFLENFLEFKNDSCH